MQKGMKCSRNGKYVGKYRKLCYKLIHGLQGSGAFETRLALVLKTVEGG